MRILSSDEEPKTDRGKPVCYALPRRKESKEGAIPSKKTYIDFPAWEFLEVVHRDDLAQIMKFGPVVLEKVLRWVNRRAYHQYEARGNTKVVAAVFESCWITMGRRKRQDNFWRHRIMSPVLVTLVLLARVLGNTSALLTYYNKIWVAAEEIVKEFCDDDEVNRILKDAAWQRKRLYSLGAIDTLARTDMTSRGSDYDFMWVSYFHGRDSSERSYKRGANYMKPDRMMTMTTRSKLDLSMMGEKMRPAGGWKEDPLGCRVRKMLNRQCNSPDQDVVRTQVRPQSFLRISYRQGMSWT